MTFVSEIRRLNTRNKKSLNLLRANLQDRNKLSYCLTVFQLLNVQEFLPKKKENKKKVKMDDEKTSIFYQNLEKAK